mmetsp:Transcript_27673/g.91987  ORF Transcript_27673/g.91987 Transcript_27673/m.91987 type:complete len:278 (+) Transcript_27673:4303-5136(+)
MVPQHGLHVARQALQRVGACRGVLGEAVADCPARDLHRGAGGEGLEGCRGGLAIGRPVLVRGRRFPLCQGLCADLPRLSGAKTCRHSVPRPGAPEGASRSCLRARARLQTPRRVHLEGATGREGLSRLKSWPPAQRPEPGVWHAGGFRGRRGPQGIFHRLAWGTEHLDHRGVPGGIAAGESKQRCASRGSAASLPRARAGLGPAAAGAGRRRAQHRCRRQGISRGQLDLHTHSRRQGGQVAFLGRVHLEIAGHGPRRLELCPCCFGSLLWRPGCGLR